MNDAAARAKALIAPLRAAMYDFGENQVRGALADLVQGLALGNAVYVEGDKYGNQVVGAVGLPQAFAVVAAENGAETDAHGKKSFFYSTGLAEGTETIAVFIAMCFFPAWFGVIAYAYASLCVLTGKFFV